LQLADFLDDFWRIKRDWLGNVPKCIPNVSDDVKIVAHQALVQSSLVSRLNHSGETGPLAQRAAK
jgi:hypothetical protein